MVKLNYRDRKALDEYRKSKIIDIICKKRNRCFSLGFNEENHKKGREVGRNREVLEEITKLKPDYD